ncbi:MAG: CPBP family intramembrane glutamic endopeptidase [Haloarculaceae archaeon]
MSRTPVVEWRRVAAFLLVAFGVSWATAAVIFVTGGLRASPQIAGPLTLAAVLLPTAYMFGPAIGNVAARLATGEGRADLWLSLDVRPAWRTYALAWLAPATLTVLGVALYYLLFPGAFDPTLAALGAALAGTGSTLAAWQVLLIQLVAAVTVAPLLNAVVAFGEEFGWRAYLLPKLLGLGRRRAVLLVGVVWGIWHWPIVAMGYNYGFSYPGAPWSGLLAMTWFTVLVGTFLGWLALRTRSVWPAALGHGAVNAIAGIGTAFLRGRPTPLLGPSGVGVVVAVPWLVVAAWLLWRDSFAPLRGAKDGVN